MKEDSKASRSNETEHKQQKNKYYFRSRYFDFNPSVVNVVSLSEGFGLGTVILVSDETKPFGISRRVSFDLFNSKSQLVVVVGVAATDAVYHAQLPIPEP